MKIFIYVCVFLCLYSCSESKHISEELNRTEEIINDYPDSVLRSFFIRWRWIKQGKP